MQKESRAKFYASIIVLFAFAAELRSDQVTNSLSATLMEMTAKIVGKTKGGIKVGTGFVVLKPFESEPPMSRKVLVTAAHVLNEIEGDNAILVFRRYDPTNGYSRVEVPTPIRLAGSPLYVTHTNADVAAIYVKSPNFRYRMGMGLIWGDDKLKELGITAGTEVMTVGYPLGRDANSFGFPILRSGRIASYPLQRVESGDTFLIDFAVFGGNSGGPVFVENHFSTATGTLNLNTVHRGIIGLVSKQLMQTETRRGIYESTEIAYPLGIAEVVHASLIIETLNMLPQSPEESFMNAAKAAAASAREAAKAAEDAAKQTAPSQEP